MSTPCHCAVRGRNVQALALLLAAGCDIDQSHWSAAARVADSYEVLLLLLAAGLVAPGCALVADDAVGVGGARKRLQCTGFAQICGRATDVCIALQSLWLPALQVVDILIEACAPFAANLDYYLLWNLVVKVKHFTPTKCHSE